MGNSTSNTRRQAALEREARKRAAAAASIKVTFRWVRDELTEAERERVDAAFAQLCLRVLGRIRGGGHHGA